MRNQVVVVDDHPVVRMAVCRILKDEGIDVVAQADNGIEALRLLDRLRPCTVVLDIGLPDVDGLMVINKIVERKWEVKVVVLSGHEPRHMALRCLKIGAHGFVSKRDDLCELVNAVKVVQANGNYFLKYVDKLYGNDDSTEGASVLKNLSAREFSVFHYLVKGMANKEISAIMSLSSKTISTYKVRILNKTGARKLFELLEFARQRGLA